MKGTMRGIHEAAGALAPSGDGTVTLFGERYRLPRAGARHADLPVLTAESLANELYWSLHCRVPSHAPHRYDVPATWSEVSRFGDELAGANAGTGAWQAGWTVRAAPAHGRVAVRAFGMDFVASAADVRAPAAGVPARRRGERLVAGASVEVRVPNEYRHFAPGYYTALGNTDHDAAVAPTTRVYWNVSPEGAAPLVGALTRRLNAAGIPFRYKTPSDPARFLRCDTGVLYLPRERVEAAARQIARVHDSVRGFLRDTGSPFVKALGPGIGAAHDAPGGTSYGSHRCTLLAEALLEAPALAAASTETRAAAAAAALERLGYDPARLYLAPGERDDLAPIRLRGGSR